MKRWKLIRTAVALGAVGMAVAAAAEPPTAEPPTADWLRATVQPLPDFVTASAGLFSRIEVPAAELRGSWLRGRVHVDGAATAAADVRLTVTAYRHQLRIASSPPGSCTRSSRSDGLSCEAISWIPDDADRVLVISYADGPGAHFHQMTLERSIAAPRLRSTAVPAFDQAFRRVSTLYYRGDEVDWPTLRACADRAARLAPQDMDPTGPLMSWVIAQLPGREHSGLMPVQTGNAAPSGNSEAASSAALATTAPELPTCEAVRPDAWLLRLPAAFGLDGAAQASYLQAAHACLLRAPSPRTWILDLRQNTGGSDELLLAAASPLLPGGLVYAWLNAQGERQDVVLTREGKWTAGTLWTRRELPLGVASERRVIAWVGPDCGSACEMLAVALRTVAHHLSVGEATAGLTTANELVPLNDRLQMRITAGWMLDARGVRIRGALVPDIVLSTDSAEQVLEAAANGPH